MLLPLALRTCHRGITRARPQSTLSSSSTTREFKVVLDNDTLYIDRELAEALGWAAGRSQTQGVPLTLSGWAPNYFVIARTGSDSDRLARATVESGHNPTVQQMLEYLKDR